MRFTWPIPGVFANLIGSVFGTMSLTTLLGFGAGSEGESTLVDDLVGYVVSRLHFQRIEC